MPARAADAEPRPGSPAIRPTHPNAIFAAGFLVLFLGGGARFAIGLTLKPMVGELGWARGEIGAAVLAYLVVSALPPISPAGWRTAPARACCSTPAWSSAASASAS